MILSGIVAVGHNGELGRSGSLPWPRLDRDMARFASLTAGRPVLMGRRTWESLPARPLPGRMNLILSRGLRFADGWDNAWTVPSLDAALTMADVFGDGEAFVIGGASVFREAAPLLDRLYLTLVCGDFPGADTFFPQEAVAEGWSVRVEGVHPDERPYPLTFLVYERNGREATA